MRTLNQLFVKMLDRIQIRLSRARPGSVLILVVVLVVLLALMGTASLSTTQADRYIATQNVANTQVDLIVQGVIEMARSTINDDLYGTLATGNFFFRPSEGVTGTTYEDYDAYETRWPPANPTPPNDMWLSPRLPTRLHATAAQLYVLWPNLARLPGVTEFETPVTMKKPNGEEPTPGTFIGVSATDLEIPRVYKERLSLPTSPAGPVTLIPTVIRPRGSADLTIQYPAFQISNPSAPGPRYVVAGDADGDGIADSGMFKFPIGEVDGVTYYVATRIIDNNSAININTAFSQASDFGVGGSMTDPFGESTISDTDGNIGMFPGHVGLLELMNNPFPPDAPTPAALAELAAVSQYRTNNSALTASAVDDAGGVIPNFNWKTRGEADAYQLARRLENPGNVTGAVKYRSFESADAAALAYRFTLQNRDISPGILESWLSNATPPGSKDSVYESAGNDDLSTTQSQRLGPNRRYYLPTPNGIAGWFDDNFHFESYSLAKPGFSFVPPTSNGSLQHNLEPNFKRPIRALLTTDNPVSNQIRMRFWDSPTGNQLPSTLKRLTYAASAGTQTSNMAPYGIGAGTGSWSPTKTNVNLAGFDELWRAYWCVMMENSATKSPFPTSGAIYDGMQFNTMGSAGSFQPSGGSHPQRMFRSPLRDPNPTVNNRQISPDHMVQLRAAIAALQTMQMRGPQLKGTYAGDEQPVMYERLQGPLISGFNQDVRVTIFGATPQPFITEVLVWRDTKSPADPAAGEGAPANPYAYVAIELYNPYPFEITLTNKYKIAMADRTTSYATAGAPMVLEDMYAFNNLVIPANSFRVIDNFNEMLALPSNVMDPVERARLADVFITAGATSWLTQTGSKLLYQAAEEQKELIIYQEIPDQDDPTGTPLKKAIDSFDFFSFIGGDPVNMSAWHYSRGCKSDERWRCVYPGRYWVHPVTDPRKERHQGTDWKEWRPALQENFNAFADNFEHSLGRASETPPLGGPATGGYLPTVTARLPIPLPSLDFGGPNKLKSVDNRYPFGGFMRNGDILQVPYIAAYTITIPNAAGDLVDMNSISMDAAFAEDSEIANDNAAATDLGEQVGRFCPVRIGTGTAIDDFQVTDTNLHRYGWARDLFDYLTVTTPSRDFLPEYPMQREWRELAGAQREFYKGDLYSFYTVVGQEMQHQIWRCDTTGPGNLGATPDPVRLVKILTATSVKNSKDVAASTVTLPLGDLTDERENDIGIQGLININTAPWRVLAAVPWVGPKSDKVAFDDPPTGMASFAAGSNNRKDNEDIARAIVYWRDGNARNTNDPPHGPFRSLFDLYNVRFQNTNVLEEVQRAILAGGDPDDAQGDFSPYDKSIPAPPDTKDNSRNDFEERYLLLTKVSNLLTTRSDSFTVYIQVQGWRGVGTLSPELVVQRRAAFIHDRSKMTTAKSRVRITPVPND